MVDIPTFYNIKLSLTNTNNITNVSYLRLMF